VAIGQGMYSNGANSTNINSGTINVTSTTGAARGFYVDSINNTFTNSASGSINATSTSSSGYAINNNGSNLILSNSGTLSGTSTSSQGYAINNNGSNLRFSNSGTLSGTSTSSFGTGFRDRTGAAITNSGTISGTSTSGEGYGLYLTGNNATITNTGTISGLTAGIFNSATGITITNSGIITGGTNSINNTGGIATLNNSQGALSSALTYQGNLPTNYNIIINSTSNYGQLAVNSVTGTMAFNIYGYTGQTLTSGVSASSVRNNYLYQNVLTGLIGSLSGSTITGTGFSISGATGTYGGYSYALVADDSNVSGVWDLLFGSLGPSATDTQSSMRYQSSQLRSAFNTQTVAANFALNYDCNVFDIKGMCISAGGRYTTIDNPNINNSAAVVTLGYKVNPNIRIGAYLDQNINISNPTGINISNNTPLMGLYAVWNKEQSGLGYQVRLANTYQDKDVTQTRTVFDTSEAGSGKTSLKSQSYLAELSYAFQYQDKTLVRPYAGLRYTHLKQDGYTEATVTSSVDNPLTVAALRDKGTTALLGVKVNRSLTDKATLTAQLGLEQDLHHKVDQYSATDLNGSELTAIAFNSNIKRTRPVASIGAFYDVTKTQRASATINYLQTPFHSTGSTTAYFNYMIGF
jgi:hypothetical protein